MRNIYHKERNIQSTEIIQNFIYFTFKVNIISTGVLVQLVCEIKKAEWRTRYPDPNKNHALDDTHIYTAQDMKKNWDPAFLYFSVF